MRGHLCTFTQLHPQRVWGVSACLGHQLGGETRDFPSKSLGVHEPSWERVALPLALSWTPISSRGLVSWACLDPRGQMSCVSTPAHCGLRWTCVVDAPERSWPTVVDTRGSPPAYLGAHNPSWTCVDACRGYSWTCVVGSSGHKLWTQNVDAVGQVVDTVRGGGWAGVVGTRGVASWICVEACCGHQWASAVDTDGSLSWKRVGSRRGLAWSRVVGRDG